jgi:hypothetical protein
VHTVKGVSAFPFQMSDVSACLAAKLSCLGFGNLLTLHLTRLRQTFFEADRDVPRDLADIPTEETMPDFLFKLQRALQVEHPVLQFQGSKGAGTWSPYLCASVLKTLGLKSRVN